MWRVASRAEDKLIEQMSLELFREDPGIAPVPAENIRRTLAKLRAEPLRGRAVVLELMGKVEGYAFLTSFWSNELGGEVCFIDEIFVMNSSRGQGHGRTLVQTLLTPNNLWPERPVAIELEVTPANIRARELYLELGFTPVKNAHMRIRF
ncbi:MAG: hypothetical protein A2X86_10425 [Bdellovibrionales bacterium GWA2_49_15]|nr:MAG: hypothetical protein A2X86_10425 [Bdellovibrionales bacterium GWA2_49_15]HAZ14744.1 hypothetical protein [Bdellovibrionales bacterium]